MKPTIIERNQLLANLNFLVKKYVKSALLPPLFLMRDVVKLIVNQL